MKSTQLNLFTRINSSLRAKLLIFFAVVTTIPITVVGVVSYSQSFSTIRENISNSATQIAAQLTTSIELVFQDSEKYLKIGNHETTIGFVNPYRQTEERTYRSALAILDLFKLFREIYEFDQKIKGIYILGLNGNHISEQEGRFTLPGSIENIKTVSAILRESGDVVYLPNRELDYTQTPAYRDVISVGKAIVRPSTRDVLGVIIVDIDRSSIDEMCETITMGETGFFSVVTGDGYFIYPQDGEYNLQDLTDTNLERIATAGEGHFIQKVDGESEFFVFTTLEHVGWKIVGRVKLKELMRGAYQIRSLTMIVVLVCIILTAVLYFFISDVLTHPIRDLKEQMAQAESGNLEVRAETKNRDEIADLSHSFNVMIGKISELMERNRKEQEELKKSELRALQAQINPHFLYNTLDAIVWMTEANNKEEVVKITKTLSSFFRIVLSKGEEWITMEEELDHIRSYLTIQKMRYRDILDYELAVDHRLQDCKVLKLMLQPLVENAIYHGIKNKRKAGFVQIKGNLIEPGTILLEVLDDGIGMTPDKLQQVRCSLEEDIFEDTIDSGYGLKNVNQRIKLYYGMEWGIQVKSGLQDGTCVSIHIPAKR